MPWMQNFQCIWILRALHYVWNSVVQRCVLYSYLYVCTPVSLTSIHAQLKVDPTFVFPDPSAAAKGFKPRGRKVVRATQDRYGHAAVVNTPEREKQRKKRFSAQPQNRNKRTK